MVNLVEDDGDSVSAVASNGKIEEGSHSKKTLDLFWKLGRAKSEKQVLDTSSKILQSTSKSPVERESVIKRLILSLAGCDVGAKNGFFVCLTEMIRQSGLSYSELMEQSKTNLKIPATTSKGEEANYLLAQMLVLSSILRAQVSLDHSQQVEMIDHLVAIGKSRNYLYLPALKLIVGHFLTDPSLLDNVVSKTAFKMDEVTIDSLFLFLSIVKLEEAEKFLTKFGVNKVVGKKCLSHYSRCLLTSNLPPGVLAEHPGFKLFVSTLLERKAINTFWQVSSSTMSAANNSGVVGFLLLKELSSHQEAVKNIPSCLTRHVISLAAQLAVKQTSGEIVKEMFANLTKACEKSGLDRLDLMKKLLEVDVCWDKLPLGNVISKILSVSDKETVKEVAKIYIHVMR